MYHVAIMKKSWGLLPKIISGGKTIESRWYHTRSAPWGKIKAGDTVYFKNSGEPVTVRAHVARVVQFSDLTPRRVKEILRKYGHKDGLATKDIPMYARLFGKKKFCILIFLESAKEVKPFRIKKGGFGAMAAWLVVTKTNSIVAKD
jgi:ASC-1-like (ASCH) protein